MVRATIETKRDEAPQAGSAEGRSPAARGLGVSPSALIASPFLPGRGLGGWCVPLLRQSATKSGECRGVQPRCQGSGGVPQSFNFFPLPPRKWARGMVCAITETKRDRAGSAEGRSPAARGLGVSPSALIASPFLEGRGLGGWCVPLLRQHSPKPKYGTPPDPRLPRCRLLAMTGRTSRECRGA